MEESLKDALFSAGAVLAEAMRAGLAAHDLPNDLHVFAQDGRIVVASRSAVVRDAEMGRPSAPPLAVMEAVAAEAAPLVTRELMRRLEALHNDRGL